MAELPKALSGRNSENTYLHRLVDAFAVVRPPEGVPSESLWYDPPFFTLFEGLHFEFVHL